MLCGGLSISEPEKLLHITGLNPKTFRIGDYV